MLMGKGSLSPLAKEERKNLIENLLHLVSFQFILSSLLFVIEIMCKFHKNASTPSSSQSLNHLEKWGTPLPPSLTCSHTLAT